MMHPRRPVSRRFQNRGFTLIELLVVISIIILVSAAAIPAFRFITSSRSTNSAYNIADAALGRARMDAMINRDIRGIFFYLDPITDRTAMVFVQPEPEASSSNDMDQYKGWDTPFNFIPTARSVALVPSTVTGNGAEVGPTGANKLIMVPFKIPFNQSSTSVEPPAAPWVLATSKYLEIVPGSDIQVLPPGVGVQLYNDPGNGASLDPDRWVRTGVILFDSQGRLISQEYAVRGITKLAATVGLAKDMPASNDPLHLFSQRGLAFYERDRFVNAQLPTGGATTDADYQLSSYFTAGFPMANPPNKQAEIDEEGWIDANADIAMINVSSGTLEFTR